MNNVLRINTFYTKILVVELKFKWGASFFVRFFFLVLEKQFLWNDSCRFINEIMWSNSKNQFLFSLFLLQYVFRNRKWPLLITHTNLWSNRKPFFKHSTPTHTVRIFCTIQHMVMVQMFSSEISEQILFNLKSIWLCWCHMQLFNLLEY